MSTKRLRQDQLKRQTQKCKHGFYLGSTCPDCMLERLQLAVRSVLPMLDESARVGTLPVGWDRGAAQTLRIALGEEEGK